MEDFVRLLQALVDANVKIDAAHFDPRALGSASYRIEIRVPDREGVEAVMNVARSLGLHSIELLPVEGAHFAPIVAVDVNYSS